jgi:hypothetical protein
MKRIGKIARLPLNIRNLLNERIELGDSGRFLIDWLNGLDEVKEILARDFDSRPINDQNFSDWKQGGFIDWQRQQETRDRLRGLAEFAADLSGGFDPADPQAITASLSTFLGAELAATVQDLLRHADDPEARLKILRMALHELHLLRIGARIAAIEQRDAVRWQIECDEREWQIKRATLNEARDVVMQPIWDAQKRAAMVTAFGGGQAAEHAADFMIKVNNDSSLKRYVDPRYFEPVQGDSSQFKPLQAPTPPPTALNSSPSSSSVDQPPSHAEGQIPPQADLNDQPSSQSPPS